MNDVTFVMFIALICSCLCNNDLLLGKRLIDERRFFEALNIFENVLMTNSQNIEALQGAAISYLNIGNIFKSAQFFEKAAFYANSPILFFNAGQQYLKLGLFNDAIVALDECIKIDSHVLRHCHIKLAQCYRDLDVPTKVQHHLHFAIRLDPRIGDAYWYLGDTYNNLKQFRLAIQAYDDAIKRLDENPSLFVAKGDAYMNLKQPQEAIKSYTKAKNIYKKLGPNVLVPDDVLVGYFFSKSELTDWKDWEEDLCQLLQSTKNAIVRYYDGNGPPSALSPYRTMFIPINATIVSDIASSWSTGLVQSNPTAHQQLNQRESGSKPESNIIHIGYLSRRFEDYPGTQLMLALFASHDRSRAIIKSFAYGTDDGSDHRRIVANTSDLFLDISAYSTSIAAEMIRNESIHVLIDYGTKKLL